MPIKKVSEEKFLNIIEDIREEGVTITRDNTIHHYPLFKIKDGSKDRIQVGHCLIPKIIHNPGIVVPTRVKGIAVHIFPTSRSAMRSLKICTVLYNIIPYAHWHIGNDEKRYNDPIKVLKKYARRNMTQEVKLIRTKK